MKNTRNVITGIGVLSPIGIGKNDYWRALAEGRSGIKPITLFDTSKLKVKVGGEITGFNAKEILGRVGLVDLDRATRLLSSAAKFALEDADLVIDDINTHRIGISVGTTFGSLNSVTEFDRVFLTDGARYVNPSKFPNTVINSPASRVAIRFKIKGYNSTISTGFCAALDAFDYAVHSLRFNRADQVLVGSVEEMCFQTFLGFYNLGYLSGLQNGTEPISRPFDKYRDGIVFSEGATVVVLEASDAALDRNATIYAEILSIESNFDPEGFHKYNKKATGIIEAMESAIRKARLKPKEIDCIFANANSTQDGDMIETKAIKQVFGEHAEKIPITAIKSMVGESFSASGGLAVVGALGTLQEGIIPATINYKTKDNFCDLNYILKQTAKKIQNIMINSFDPNGANTVLILSQFKGGKRYD